MCSSDLINSGANANNSWKQTGGFVDNETANKNRIIGLWAKESVYAMWQAGVMQGEGQNQFHPENGYTCEQAIATMLRMTMIEV